MCNVPKNIFNCFLHNAEAFPLKMAKKFPVQHSKCSFIHNVPYIQIFPPNQMMDVKYVTK